MSSTNEPWFVAERSEALAGVLLTSRKDVRIRSERKDDSGLDLIVEICTGDTLSTQQFVVQVKGTTSSDSKDWMQGVKHLFRGQGASDLLAGVRLRGERPRQQGLLRVGGRTPGRGEGRHAAVPRDGYISSAQPGGGQRYRRSGEGLVRRAGQATHARVRAAAPLRARHEE